MTLKRIVNEAKFWLGRADCSDGVGDEHTRKLVECARRTLEKIALEYAPLVDVATVVASGGKFTVSALPKRAIAIKKVSKDGETIAFRCLGDVC